LAANLKETNLPWHTYGMAGYKYFTKIKMHTFKPLLTKKIITFAQSNKKTNKRTTSMKKTISLLACLSLFSAAALADDMPSQKSTMEILVKVNDYYMKKHPDPRTPTFVKRERTSNLWTRAVYFEGLSALYAISPKKEYFEYMYQWGDFHEWAPRYGNTSRNADDYCCGQTYIDLYLLCRERRLCATFALTQECSSARRR